jgi:hypothetical protein
VSRIMSNIIVRPAPVGSRWLDTVEVLTPAIIADAKAMGFDGVVRYADSLTIIEKMDILNGQMGLQTAGYSRPAGWIPSPQLGIDDGNKYVAFLKSLVILPTCTHWIDNEGMNISGSTNIARMGYINQYAKILLGAGFDPGAYIGYGVGLNNAELYSTVPDHYWHSLSKVTDEVGAISEPNCGWSFYQLYPTQNLRGIGSVDISVVQMDYQGRRPNCMALDTTKMFGD